MRVTGDDGLKPRRSWVDVELAEIVKDIERSLAGFHHLASPKTGRPNTCVVVSANRNNRGDGSEPFQHRERADVPRVDDEFRACESRNRFGSEQPVGIGDNAESPGER